MGNKVTVTRIEGNELKSYEFENVIGHQVGNGAVQILERSGNQTIINNYFDVFVELDEEAKAKFAIDLAEMENPTVGDTPTTDDLESIESEEDDQPSVQ